jgi:hypothetical protein
MAEISVQGSALGSSLNQLLLSDEIVPGAQPGYELCKVIFLYHPLGQKIAEAPITMAQSQPREIAVPDGPEEDAKQAFVKEWERIGANKIIRNFGTQARIYGIASLGALEKSVSSSTPLELDRLADAELAFNVWDPLNTAGSLVLNQDPNALDFQKHRDISVNGVRYHRSRTVTLMNESPLYITYQSSGFGFVGRSVYQRALFPLKSFIQTMIADDMVAKKVGVIVAMIKMAGSIADAVVAAANAFKRAVIKISQNENVISVGNEDKIESLDLKNLEGPLNQARKDILENIASAVPMPAKLLNNETFAEGFGEGTEDAKHVAEYIDFIREWLQPAYAFMDMIVQRRAWNQRFFAAMKRKHPELYASMSHEEAFGRWVNSFSATWPSLLREPESELVKVEETKCKNAIGFAEIILPEVDPTNKGIVLQWLADVVNSSKHLFEARLVLDWDALAAYTPPELPALEEPAPGRPKSAADAAAEPGKKVEDFVRANAGVLSVIAGRQG